MYHLQKKITIYTVTKIRIWLSEVDLHMQSLAVERIIALRPLIETRKHMEWKSAILELFDLPVIDEQGKLSCP